MCFTQFHRHREFTKMRREKFASNERTWEKTLEKKKGKKKKKTIERNNLLDKAFIVRMMLETGKRTNEHSEKLVSSKELENIKTQTELKNTITERKKYTGRNQQ